MEKQTLSKAAMAATIKQRQQQQNNGSNNKRTAATKATYISIKKRMFISIGVLKGYQKRDRNEIQSDGNLYTLFSP